MKNELRCAALLCVLLPTGLVAAQEQEPPCNCEEKEPYATKGTFEIGGSIGMDWTEELFTLHAGPSAGWFVEDSLEISAFLRLEYANAKEDDGSRSSITTGELVLEPSFHFPLGSETVFGFGGLGVGGIYDGDHTDFELVPRMGLNIEVGAAIFTPALSIPLVFGSHDGDDASMLAGATIEFGITTTL